MAKPKRDSKGRYLKKKSAKRRGRKVAAKTTTVRRRRRKVKAKANPSPIRRRRRRVARKVRANPTPIRRRRRRVARKVRANPSRRRRTRRNPLSKRTIKSLARRYKASKKRVGKARGKTRKMVAASQARRHGLALRIAQSRGMSKAKLRSRMSPLARAMSIKSNPGLAGLKTAAMVLVPQAGVGALGLFGLAMAGKKVGGMIQAKMAADSAIRPFVPAIATAGLSVVAYVIADKVAPKFKGAIAIGGMLAAIVQAVMAAKPGALDSAKGALVGEYTAVGGGGGIFGEYTSIGNRGVGEYTAVGAGGDNATEWSHDSLRGLDDASEFAPGEGGILSGGIFC